MTLTTQRLTLADYCQYDDGSDTRYELLNGELIPMALGLGQHGEIADFLNRQFYQAITQDNQAWVSKQMVIGVR
jgi:Uma2 family endonuclease